MRVASGVIREDVEDAELGLTEANSEPRRRSRFLLNEWHSGTEKLFDLCFLTRLCSNRTSNPLLTIMILL